jgi:hypothetical protein
MPQWRRELRALPVSPDDVKNGFQARPELPFISAADCRFRPAWTLYDQLIRIKELVHVVHPILHQHDQLALRLGE